MMYTQEQLEALATFYKHQLLEDTIPFWFPRSYDQAHGGFLFMRDADGSLIDDDKAVWIQGRAVWTLSTLYNTIEKKQEWLDGAKLGYDFLNKHCFDTDGQMFFHVMRDGTPIRKRRYFFSETLAMKKQLIMHERYLQNASSMLQRPVFCHLNFMGKDLVLVLACL